MTGVATTVSRAEEFRTAFDQTYAIPASSQAAEQIEDLLAIRVSGDAYAVRLGEVSGLAKDRKIVMCPSPIPEFLGIAGIRGGLVSVYGLSALLGYATQADPGRWLMLCGREELVGLAFSEFEGYLRVRRTQVHATEQKDVARAHVTHVVRADGRVRAIVSIPHLRELIQKRCDKQSVSKEQ